MIPIGIVTQVSMPKSPKQIEKGPRPGDGARIRRALAALARLLGRQAASDEAFPRSPGEATKENSDEK